MNASTVSSSYVGAEVSEEAINKAASICQNKIQAARKKFHAERAQACSIFSERCKSALAVPDVEEALLQARVELNLAFDSIDLAFKCAEQQAVTQFYAAQHPVLH